MELLLGLEGEGGGVDNKHLVWSFFDKLQVVGSFTIDVSCNPRIKS